MPSWLVPVWGYLSGKKTYLAAVGLALLALADYLSGDSVSASQHWFEAIGFVGLRHAVEKGQTPAPPEQQPAPDMAKPTDPKS